MNEAINTGFKDKSGRPIYVNDIVQHRLGKFGKSGGTQHFKVIQYGKGYDLVRESHTDEKYGGQTLTAKMTEHLIVIKSDHIRG